jgi:cytochrome P450
MLEAERDSEVDFPATQVRDEVVTFLFAGHETTALTLVYTLWYLGRNPDVAAVSVGKHRPAVRGKWSLTTRRLPILRPRRR